jgi:hypothetical protein
MGFRRENNGTPTQNCRPIRRETTVTGNLQQLIEIAAARRAEFIAARERLEAAERDVLEARFKDDAKFSEGDMVLVPRKLFGKLEMVPARVADVHLKYSEGVYGHGPRAGEAWSTKSILYRVFHQRADGTFATNSESYYHHDVQSMPEGRRA